ncbi:hypothetical protein ACLMJK_002668 [Lecanora helva]
MAIRRRFGSKWPMLILGILSTAMFTRKAFAQRTLSVTMSTSDALTAVSSTDLADVTSKPPVATVTPTASPKQPNGDPCGPAIQDNPNYPNTCNLIPSYVQSPNPYGINCSLTYDVQKYPNVGLNWDNCAASLKSICTKMEDSRTQTGLWIWSKLATNCALGFYLPPYQGSAPRPSAQRCVNIFTAMQNTCKTTAAPNDVASINIRALPGFDPAYWNSGFTEQMTVNNNFTGEAVNVGYPSFLLHSGIIGPAAWA